MLPRHSTNSSIRHPRQHAPHQWTRPVYGARVQYAPAPDDKALLPAADIKRVQQVVGTLLYYARAVDSTMLVALNAISASQSKATENTAAAIVHLLDYAATHPNAILRYQRSDMVLHIHSDASYLSAPEARSRAGGHHFLSSRPADPTKAPSRQPTNNGSIHAECSVLRNVMASAAEAEIGALYINSQTAEVFRTTLIEMGHPQPPTTIQTDNSTAYGCLRHCQLIHTPTACDSIEYATAFAKTISSSTGNPVTKTLVTTSPSITRRPTIKPCTPHISLKPLFALQIALQVVCEGVLILA